MKHLMCIMFCAIAPDTLKATGVEFQEFEPKSPWMVSKDAAKRAFSTLDGKRAVLDPSGLVFTLPEKWVKADMQARTEKGILPCIFMSSKDVGTVAQGSRGMYRVYTSVLNAILPFDRCVIDASRLPWDSFSFESRVRIYDLTYTVDEFKQRMEKQGADEASRISRKKCGVKHSRHGDWSVTSVTVTWQDDDLLTQVAFDFYARRIGKTLIIVVNAGQATEIGQILDDIDRSAPKK
jgi:hypothetical protein